MEPTYQETIACEPRPEEGVILIKVAAMPHEDAVEFDMAQARFFAQRILAAVEVVEAGWVGGSTGAAGGVGTP